MSKRDAIYMDGVACHHGRDLTASPPRQEGRYFSEFRSYRFMERTTSTDLVKNKFGYSDLPL